MKSLEEWAEELEKRIRRLILTPALMAHEDFTDDERAGKPDTMMPAVYWPKRWLIEMARAYAAQVRQDEREAFKKILEEPFVVGTRVTNCVVHMSLNFYSRPRNCDLCALDIVSHLQLAIRMNKFLNEKVDAAAIRAREP